MKINGSNQRKHKRRLLLSAEKIQELDSLEFIWDDDWEKMFKQLLEYKAKYGHAIISMNHKKRNFLSAWQARREEPGKKES